MVRCRMSKFVLSLCFVIALSSCNNNVGNSSSGNNQGGGTGAPQSLPYTLGGTYDSMSGYPTSTTSCLAAASSLPGAMIISDPSATMDFSQTQSLSEVEKALGVSVSITIGWGAFAVHTGYSYARSSQDDAYTLNINYVYRYAGTAEFNPMYSIQGESALTNIAQNVLYSPTQFRTMCGDGFVSSLEAGASVLFRLTLTFNSWVDRDSFVSTLQPLGGLQNVLAIIEQNPGNISYNLSAAGMQVGGDPQAFNQIFSENGGGTGVDGYEVLQCGTGAEPGVVGSKCVGLVDDLLGYVSLIAGQLNNSTYYLSNPTITTWNQAGIYPGDVNPNPAVLSAMESVTNNYNQVVNNYNFAQHYLSALESVPLLLSESMSSNLQSLVNLYGYAQTIFTDPSNNVMDCYNGFVSTDCINVNQNLQNLLLGILGPESSVNYQWSLLNYLQNNQYATKLLTNYNESTTSTTSCGLFPISDWNENIYSVNCEGESQIAGNLSGNNVITVVPQGNTLMVTNLYNYANGHRYTYSFSAPLQSYGTFPGSYYGNATVLMDNNPTPILTNYPVSVVNYYLN